MLRYLIRRLGSSALVVLILTFITFVLSRVLPSDPAVVYIGPKATPEDVARLRTQLGLDQPILAQYWTYLKSLVVGDWGDSLATKRPVLEEIASRLPATLELIAAAMSIAIVFGITLGVLASRRPGGRLDGIIRILAIGGVSMPAFWLGLLLQVVFVGRLNLLPATGEFTNSLKFTHPITDVTGFPLLDSLVTANWVAVGDGMTHLLLPALTLAAYPLGLIARMTRGSMIETLSQDYVTTARAYGARERTIMSTLALRNALSPTLTVIGLAIAYSITGTFFVETVFNWPGIGQFAVQSMLAVDYPAIMAITLLGAAAYLATNIVVDILQARVDPRVRVV